MNLRFPRAFVLPEILDEVQYVEHKAGRAKVAGGQDHEVRYEAQKTGASKTEVKQAVRSVGNSRDAVEKS